MVEVLEKSEPVRAEIRLRFIWTEGTVAAPSTWLSASWQSMATSVVKLSEPEKPNRLTDCPIKPIYDDGILTVIGCEAVAAVGSPVV